MKKLSLLFFTLFSFIQLMANDLIWNAPETLSTVLMNASDPQITMDVEGNATAVWVEDGFVKANYLPVDGSWGVTATLSTSGSSSPRLGVDLSGNVTAVWLDDGVVMTATSQAGSWGLSTALSSSGASWPAIAIRPNGDAVVVWTRGGFIESKTKLILGLWSLVSMISGANSNNPDVAIGADGTVAAIWHTVSSGANIVVSATQLIGGVWTTPKALIQLSSAYSHDYPKIAVDQDGNASAIWFRYQYNDGNYINVGVFASVLPKNAAGWLPIPTILSGPGIRNPADLVAKISYDSQGNAMALWTISFDNSLFNVETSMKFIGGEWTQKVLLTENNVYSFAGDICANALGSVVGVYMMSSGSDLTIQSTEANISGSSPEIFWTPSIQISTASGNAYPKVASTFQSPDVHAAAAWLSYDGVNTTLQVATGSKQSIDPPSNLSVMQSITDFGVYADYTNTISWSPSSSPNIIEYDLYRNGIFFARVGSNTFEAMEHNVNPNESVTYGVSALDNQTTQSETVYINFP